MRLKTILIVTALVSSLLGAVIAYLVLKARSWGGTHKPGGLGPFGNGPGPGQSATSPTWLDAGKSRHR